MYPQKCFLDPSIALYCICDLPSAVIEIREGEMLLLKTLKIRKPSSIIMNEYVSVPLVVIFPCRLSFL